MHLTVCFPVFTSLCLAVSVCIPTFRPVKLAGERQFVRIVKEWLIMAESRNSAMQIWHHNQRKVFSMLFSVLCHRRLNSSDLSGPALAWIWFLCQSHSNHCSVFSVQVESDSVTPHSTKHYSLDLSFLNGIWHQRQTRKRRSIRAKVPLQNLSLQLI